MIGGKALTVQLVLEKMPEDTLGLLTSHVSANGWAGSMFFDDSLSSKRIYPPFIFKYGKPGWNDRLKVTERSITLMFNRLIADFESKPPTLRRKVTKKDMDDAAEMAALVNSLYEDSLLPRVRTPHCILKLLSHLPF